MTELPVVAVVAAGCLVVAGWVTVAVLVLRSRRRDLDLRRAARAGEEADRSLRSAEALTEHLVRALNAIPQGVVVTDADGEVVVRNDVAAHFAEGRHGEALVHAAVEELLAEALAGAPAARSVELFGNPRRTLTVASTPLDDEGRPAGALVVIDDISERRRLESVRRDFVANISHELKTPVAAMSLLAETLAAEEDPATARRLAARILDEAFRVDRTIEDLLALSRIESEEGFRADVVEIDAILADAADRTRVAAEQSGIEVTLEVVTPDLVLRGDHRQLVSAVANLVDNAVKYSDAGASVAVRAGRVGDRVEIAVQDRGIGIPARDLERIFERFYRVDQARSRATGGTGLGLAIVRHVAANHGGEVRVASRTGEGSCFTLSLPLERDRTPAPEPSTPAPNPPAPPEPTIEAGHR